jgi:hypothetical protein
VRQGLHAGKVVGSGLTGKGKVHSETARVASGSNIPALVGVPVIGGSGGGSYSKRWRRRKCGAHEMSGGRLGSGAH